MLGAKNVVVTKFAKHARQVMLWLEVNAAYVPQLAALPANLIA